MISINGSDLLAPPPLICRKVLVFRCGLYFGPCQIKLIMKAFKKLITEVAKQFFIVHLKALGIFFLLQ